MTKIEYFLQLIVKLIFASKIKLLKISYKTKILKVFSKDIFFSSLNDVSRSRIPVRKDSPPSRAPSLPSSGRSTPVHRPAMQRESSSPPGLLPSRPAIAPKPKIIGSAMSRQGSSSSLLDRQGSSSSLVDRQMSASLSVDRKETAAAGRLSKIPRPEKGLRKWDSTPTLEVIFFIQSYI